MASAELLSRGQLGTLQSAASYAAAGTIGGVVVGALVTAAVKPPTASDTSQDATGRALAAVLLNGVAIVVASRLLEAERDPTGGIMFTWALIASQPNLHGRFAALTTVVERAIVKNAPKAVKVAEAAVDGGVQAARS